MVRPERLTPLTITDQFLAVILDELRGLRGQLAQESPPPYPEKPELRLVSEPEPAPRLTSAAPPPRSGPGSGRDVWAAYADRLGVVYPSDADRRTIIAAVGAD